MIFKLLQTPSLVMELIKLKGLIRRMHTKSLLDGENILLYLCNVQLK